MLEPKISLNDRSHYQKTLDSFFKSVKWNSFAQQHVEKVSHYIILVLFKKKKNSYITYLRYFLLVILV